MDEPHVIGSRFTLERLIGQGGIGQVYYGIDQQTHEPVAIKALKPHVVEENPKLVERFQREGEALKELDHPCIVKMLEMVEENKRYYIIMEYVSGGSLHDLLKKQGKLPLERILHIGLDLSDALTRAHRLKIIHRDIKPANVLLASDGTPRLTDFGAARIERLKSLTTEGNIVGTVSYLSPEACQGKSIDPKIDIWSFGIMLYEMLTGQRPFDKSTTMATVLSIIRDPLPDLVALWPEVSPKLINLIYQMLEKDPKQRIASMRLVGAELESIIEQSDSGTRQALNLIYRMLEKEDTPPTSGVRIVEAQLGAAPNHPVSESSLPPKAKTLTIDQFVKEDETVKLSRNKSQSRAQSETAVSAPSSPAQLPAARGASRAISQNLLIVGMMVTIVVLIIVIVALLL